MYILTDCPICKSDDVQYQRAYLSRFILSIIKGKVKNIDIPISSLICNRCAFYCSSIRFDDHEMAQIYKNYRGHDYNKLRVQVEGDWYAGLIGTFTSPETIDRRLQGVSLLINKHIDINQIETVLDYGGGSGHFIPKEFANKEKYVYDVSNSVLCPGVKRFIKDRQIDFNYIQCCHVLEHVTDPISFLEEMLSLANTETYIYIEVPDGDGAPADGFWHEHINTFFDNSLEFLLNKVNLKIIDKIKAHKSIGILAIKAAE